MKVLVAADPGEVRPALFAAIRESGPVYLRLGRGVGGILHKPLPEADFTIGKAEILRNGSDVTIVAVGVMVERALQAAKLLASGGIESTVINLRSVKPLDVDTVIEYAKQTRAIVTAEDHNKFGGTFSAICELLSEKYPVPVERVAIEDQFGESGSGEQLLEKYGLTPMNIAEKARHCISRKREDCL
jgi:transketolase